MVSRTPAVHELGDLQLQILRILWEKGEASVHEMLEHWQEAPSEQLSALGQLKADARRQTPDASKSGQAPVPPLSQPRAESREPRAPAKPAYVTILTVCRRLEKRGLLAHREHKERKTVRAAFVYRALVEREALQQQAMEDLVRRMGIPPEALIVYGMKHFPVHTAELTPQGLVVHDPPLINKGGMNVSCTVAGCHSCGSHGR